MDFKRFWKESWAALVIRHVLLALLVVFIISYITLSFIDKYTRHGEAEVVPDLKGRYTEEADILLAAQGLRYEVIDSTYDRSQPFGVIVEQTPPQGSFLKKGRPVYLIINAKSIRQVPLPDVRDVSFRQADAMLKASGLKVGNVTYEPSEFKDLVLDVRKDEQPIKPGTRIPEGTTIDLIVGQGIGTENVFVPNLAGLPATEIRNTLLSSLLVVGAVNYDVPPANDNDQYIVYLQEPQAGTQVPSGTRIDVWLSKDPSKVTQQENTSSEDDFF